MNRFSKRGGGSHILQHVPCLDPGELKTRGQALAVASWDWEQWDGAGFPDLGEVRTGRRDPLRTAWESVLDGCT